jgi:hypothetical protein
VTFESWGLFNRIHGLDPSRNSAGRKSAACLQACQAMSYICPSKGPGD